RGRASQQTESSVACENCPDEECSGNRGLALATWKAIHEVAAIANAIVSLGKNSPVRLAEWQIEVRCVPEVNLTELLWISQARHPPRPVCVRHLWHSADILPSPIRLSSASTRPLSLTFYLLICCQFFDAHSDSRKRALNKNQNRDCSRSTTKFINIEEGPA